MRKIIILSFLSLLVLSSSLYGDRVEHREHKHVKKPHHIKRVHNNNRVERAQDRHRYVRPNKRDKYHPRKSYIRKSHYVAKHRRPGYRTKYLHRDAFYFSLGGLTYHYMRGAFYRPYRNGYRVVRAPIGAFIYDLPVGYMRIYIGNNTFYRYEDTYYERDRYESGYRVIEEPREYVRDVSPRYYRGDVVLTLPVGAVEVIINGLHYYEFGNTYFSLSLRNGRRVYTVVDIY